MRGFNVTQIRDEARPLLNCASGGDDPLVNGRISYGKYDEKAEDDTRHGLCIGGNPKQGHSKCRGCHYWVWNADTHDRLLARYNRKGGGRGQAKGESESGLAKAEIKTKSSPCSRRQCRMLRLHV